jgi:hypothetical protein
VQKARTNRLESSQFNSRIRDVSGPDVIDIDTLGTMLDEDLVTRSRMLDEGKNQAFNSGHDSQPWEEEIAYVRREQHLRRLRRDAHTEWLRREQLAFVDAERGLPAGDFDNSIFVYAATGGRPRWN